MSAIQMDDGMKSGLLLRLMICFEMSLSFAMSQNQFIPFSMESIFASATICRIRKRNVILRISPSFTVGTFLQEVTPHRPTLWIFLRRYIYARDVVDVYRKVRHI